MYNMIFCFDEPFQSIRSMFVFNILLYKVNPIRQQHYSLVLFKYVHLATRLVAMADLNVLLDIYTSGVREWIQIQEKITITLKYFPY